MAKHRRVHVKSYVNKKGRRVRAHDRLVTKSDIVSKVSEKHKDLKHKDISDVFESTVEVIGNSLKSGSDVRINGLGIFKIKARAARPARKCRNPATGAEMMSKPKPASKVIRFRPAKELKP